MQVNFQEISIKETKRWKDSDGKPRQKTKKFWQTINPFNKNSDGSLKTREQILSELRSEVENWKRVAGDE